MQAEHILAAVATAWALGMEATLIRAGIESFPGAIASLADVQADTAVQENMIESSIPSY
jgi:hypothetical protein